MPYACISGQLSFLFHITRQRQFVYFNAVLTTVRILAVGVLGGTEPCILKCRVSESALNPLNSSAFYNYCKQMRWMTVNCFKTHLIERGRRRIWGAVRGTTPIITGRGGGVRKDYCFEGFDAVRARPCCKGRLVAK
jgi:hypothetical protein